MPMLWLLLQKNETEDVSLTNDSKAKNTEKSIKRKFK